MEVSIMAEATGGSAIVLGGGGVTGIAWEIGVLAGLLDAGVDLGADAVFGTSAGSFVGTALTAAWGWAFVRGRGNPERVGGRPGFAAPGDTGL
jgi:NTE family protein